MPGMQFEYDEHGGTFYYFLLSFIALILIPATYYLWPRKSSKGDCHNSACSVPCDVHVTVSCVSYTCFINSRLVINSLKPVRRNTAPSTLAAPANSGCVLFQRPGPVSLRNRWSWFNRSGPRKKNGHSNCLQAISFTSERLAVFSSCKPH